MEEAERMACCQDVLSEKGSLLLLECKYKVGLYIERVEASKAWLPDFAFTAICDHSDIFSPSSKATAGFTPLLFIFIFFPI